MNVVVAEEHRGLGVGKQVMRAAMSRAVHHWGAQRLYTHVEADNEVRLVRGAKGAVGFRCGGLAECMAAPACPLLLTVNIKHSLLCVCPCMLARLPTACTAAVGLRSTARRPSTQTH